MTWRDLVAFLIERERLRWTIRVLLVKLALVRARHFIRCALTPERG